MGCKEIEGYQKLTFKVPTRKYETFLLGHYWAHVLSNIGI